MTAATSEPELGRFSVNLTLEPESGRAGEQAVLETLARSGLALEPLAGTGRMRVRIPLVEARSNAEAEQKAVNLVRSLVPASGYRLVVEESMISRSSLQAAPTA